MTILAIFGLFGPEISPNLAAQGPNLGAYEEKMNWKPLRQTCIFKNMHFRASEQLKIAQDEKNSYFGGLK